MSMHHWNYFLAIETDVVHLSRYIEFDRANFAAYSIEIARLLMATTQEIDVVLKQICTLKGGAADNEQSYRGFIPGIYPKFPNAEVELRRSGLSFVPFAAWTSGITPLWWTANNKIKHERHNHFAKASLENMLNSLCALFVSNLYFRDANGTIVDLVPGPTSLDPVGMGEDTTWTKFGFVPNYKLL